MRAREKGGRKGVRKGDRRGKGTGTDRACYFQSLFPLYCLLWNKNKGKKKKFTPISKSLTSFLTDVVSALLFN